MIEQLKKLRESHGYSQTYVAKQIGYTQSALSLHENGERLMNIIDQKRYANLFDLDVEIKLKERDKDIYNLDFENCEVDWTSKGKNYFNSIWNNKENFVIPHDLHPKEGDNEKVLTNKKKFYDAIKKQMFVTVPDYTTEQLDNIKSYLYFDYCSDISGPTIIQFNINQFLIAFEQLVTSNETELSILFNPRYYRYSIHVVNMLIGDYTVSLYDLLKNHHCIEKSFSMGFNYYKTL